MKTKPISRISAAILGLASFATLGVAQEAQAGTVTSSSTVAFEDVTLTLNGDSVVELFFDTVNGTSFVDLDGNSDDDLFASGPLQCPNSLTGSASATVPNGVSNSGATVDCTTDFVDTSNFAETEMTGNQGQANALGAYTIFTQNFDVVAGDFLDLTGTLNAEVFAEIEDWSPGETKTAAADFLGTYEVFLDNVVVFRGPPLDLAVALVNQNGIETDAIINFPLDGFDYTFDDSGSARIQFSAREQASSSIARAPEPSAVISLTTVGIAALVSRNKRKNSAK